MMNVEVTAAGDWFHGMVYASVLAFWKWGPRFDMIILDDCPSPAPLLKLLFRTKIFFYCHFPYQLLIPLRSVREVLIFIEMYLIEGWCMKFCDFIAVNSKFTRCKVQHFLPSLSKRNCSILYPTISADLDACDRRSAVDIVPNNKVMFLSLNRYWPGKKIEVAIQALSILKQKLQRLQWMNIELVVAGSVEHRLSYCANYSKYLKRLSQSLGVSENVKFLENISRAKKATLLAGCRALLYTAPFEHFGIGPLEAMHFGKPVIAVDGCGINETVLPNQTGVLVPFSPSAFADAMASIIADDRLNKVCAARGRDWVNQNFGRDAFDKRLMRLLDLSS
ncbi:unnamed protein product [Soboliphyme baturini]|uniref:Alpha-1,3/1,6-mannosyltransferase ALG2 n=1 Tax=Soboliphyme baturini TaxID=241478 RepID=A0A183IT83_9BILA|nr:unnamed protein product [Soboliphyme baturini]